MKSIIFLAAMCVAASGVSAKGVCADNVCEKFYNAAITSHLSASMQSIITTDEATRKGSQEAAIAHYVSSMKAVTQEMKGRVQPEYQASLASAKGNKEVTASIKNLYTKWLSGINYFEKSVLDSQYAKDLQYKKDKISIEEAWVKLQVEAGI